MSEPGPTWEPPFRTKVRPASSAAPDGELAPLPESGEEADGDWSVHEIEAAYLRALEAAESAELSVADDPVADESIATEDSRESLPGEPPRDAMRAEAAVASTSIDSEPSSPHEVAIDAADEQTRVAPAVTSRQIVEALLFVGGRPLSARQMADVLGGSHTPEQVDELVRSLNEDYARQQRPYEVRFGEGGYRLELRSSFEKVRNRVFGFGPREVRLTQSALEVLALIAYKQPITRQEIEELAPQGSLGLLRQLLRRELIVLRRGEGGEDVRYETTARFLELFGLRTLDELPQPELLDRR